LQRHAGATVHGYAEVSNGVDLRGGGLYVAEDGATVHGGIGADAGLTSVGILQFHGAQVDFAQSTVAGGIRASGSLEIMQGGLAVSRTGASFTGGLNVSQVGLHVMDGGLNVLHAGAVVSGGERVVSGGLQVHGFGDVAGTARIRGGISLRSAITIKAGGLHILEGAGIGIANGMRATDAGVKVAGRFEVFSGETVVHGGLQAKSDGVRVATGGATVRSGGVSVAHGNATFLLDVVADGKGTTGMRDVSGATGMVISEIGEMRVSGGAALYGGLTAVGGLWALNGTQISSGGMTLSGWLLVRGGFEVDGNTSSTNGAAARGGLVTSGLPLVVDGGATIFGSRQSTVSGGLVVSDFGADIQSGGATMLGGAVAHAPITVSTSDLSGKSYS